MRPNHRQMLDDLVSSVFLSILFFCTLFALVLLTF